MITNFINKINAWLQTVMFCNQIVILISILIITGFLYQMGNRISEIEEILKVMVLRPDL